MNLIESVLPKTNSSKVRSRRAASGGLFPHAGPRPGACRSGAGLADQPAAAGAKQMSQKPIKTVLLVEDNPGDARLLREMLNEEGFRSAEFTHVVCMNEAEKHLAKHQVDIVLLDLGLPDAQGLAAVRRAHAVAPRVPLVVLTGLDDGSLAEQALQEGAQDYLIKGQIESLGLRRALRYAFERKRTEAEMRRYVEREQLFIAVVESSNDAIVTETLDGIITGWNEAAERLFGFAPQEAIGQSIDVIVPDDLRMEVLDILDRIRRGERVQDHETVRRSKDGRRFDVSLSISPIKSPSGAIIGAAKAARDITEKRKAQERLLESEQMARGIIAHALEAFIQVDEGGRVLEWNPQAEAIFGWTRQEAVGSPLTSLFLPKEFGPRHPKLSAQLLQEENATVGERFELEAIRRDGEKIKIEVSLIALRRRTGCVFNSFVRDLTEKIAAEEKLRHAQKMEAVGQLTGGIAHDFNNMLTVITSTIDFLAEAVSDRQELAEITTLISEAASQGAQLTGHLLAFARKQPLQPREIDINALLRESTKLMLPTLGEHIEIRAMLKDRVWPALVDPSQLSTALLNLALNARDAMPSGGKLTLETDNIVLDESYAALNRDVQPGNYVMISVSDNGTGIPEAIRDKIFEPFFSTKEVGKGTGLGLSMVYGFVKQSNGHIKIYSEEGHGTTFRIYLPQGGGTPSDQPVKVVSEDLIGGDNETILVVEDDRLVRTSVTAQLRGLGYRTISASNAGEAIAAIEGGAAFDLLFTDLVMPGPMNGRQLAEEVARRHPPLKVLFTSGYMEDVVVHHGRLDPDILLLAKPYRKTDLARMVRVALNASPASLHDGATRLKAKRIG
jgi:PAS domain S-box-containing protein